MSFLLTQSSLKDLERDETCPFRWKAQWIDKIIPFKVSEDMDKGNYFEYLVLGKGAKGNETTDLTRLKNGHKSTDQTRIEQQAERCRRMLYDRNDPEFLGLVPIAVQAKFSHDGREGTLDILATELDAPNVRWLIDLKLTKDLSADHSKWSWGRDWRELDFIQLSHYSDLVEKEFGERPKIGLLVLDYSPKKRAEFGEIQLTETKRKEKEERFQAGEEAISLYNKNGWIKIPNHSECEGCPLQCDKRMGTAKLIRKTVIY